RPPPPRLAGRGGTRRPGLHPDRPRPARPRRPAGRLAPAAAPAAAGDQEPPGVGRPGGGPPGGEAGGRGAAAVAPRWVRRVAWAVGEGPVPVQLVHQYLDRL